MTTTQAARQQKTYLRLTPRWEALRFHPVQYQCWNSPARFKTIHAGRRAGKTEIFGLRKPVLWMWDCLVKPRPWTNPRRFIAAPTRSQVKQIFWKNLKALTPGPWVDYISETDLAIVTKWGAELILVGLDQPARIEGQPWDEGTIDEFSNCKPELFDAHIRPAMTDRGGGVDFLGVPDMHGPSQGEYEKMCRRGRSGKDPEWADFAWATGDIQPASEIKSMRSTMDPRVFEQETSGEFLFASGRACPDFEDAPPFVVVSPYDPSLPVCWSLDFNVNPLCSGVIQHAAGVVRVIDELSIPDTVTGAACAKFLARAKSRNWNLSGLTVYGDATGSGRSTAAAKPGQTDWTIVRNALAGVPGVRYRYNTHNPERKDTLNAVNAKIKAADGTIGVRIDPSCTGLIADLLDAAWPSDLEPQHRLAWFRYFVEREYPVRSAAARGPYQVAVQQ